MAAQQRLPTGIVTFLFTDIEGSTQLWERHSQQMRGALARHDALLRTAVLDHGGGVVKSTGDGLLAVFAAAAPALAAALAAQRALAAEPWPQIAPHHLRVRMGLHSGEADLREQDYFGTAVNRAARVMALGHGEQILLSAATAVLLQDTLPAGTSLRDLGDFPLRGLSRNEQIYQVLAPDLRPDFPPLNSDKGSAGNLPAPAGSFIGRAREMAEVQAALAQTRLLTLTGPGGTGKTRLSLQVAAAVQDSYKDGAWLVELAPIPDPDLVATAVAGIFGLSGQPANETRDMLVDFLREKELLLVLDNCEHLIAACARLAADLGAACPRLTIFASSREVLNVYGETTYHLPTLSLPSPSEVTLREIGRSEAVQLFVARAAAAQPGFRLTETNAPPTAQVVRRLDGIPLAIELAAARLKAFSVEQIAARLDDRFRLLTGGSRTALPRQQTLRALIDWSYDLLEEEERQLFRRLSVFMGGWTLEAAESIAGALDIYTLLPDLVSKSLVTLQTEGASEGHEPRYLFLETIRQYARDRLVESGEMVDARDRHFAYYEALAESVNFGDGPGMADLVSGRFDPEVDNLRAALEWATDRYPQRALTLIWNLFPMMADQIPGSQSIDWTVGALRGLDERLAAGAEVPPEIAAVRLQGMVTHSLLLLFMGQLKDAGSAAGQAVDQMQEVEIDPVVPAMALFAQAQAAYLLDDPSYGEFAVRAAALFRRARGHVLSGPMLAINLYYTHVWHAQRGETELAEQELQEVAQLARLSRASSLPWLQYSSLMVSIQTLIDPDQTRQAYETTIRSLRRGGSRRMGAMLESDWAHRQRHQGQLAEALEIYRRVLPEWRALGHRAAVANILENIAFVKRVTGDPARTAVLLGAAERIREEIGQDMLRHEREDYERELAALRAALPPQELAPLWARGRALPTDALIALAQEDGAL